VKKLLITDRELHIKTQEMQRDGKDTYYFHKYEPTSYEVLEALVQELSISRDDGFVDYGCGMGRLNFYVHHFFHCRSVGVELNEQYYNDAIKNLNSYSRHHKHATQDISFYHLKAEEYEVRKEDTVFYFFNPFSSEIFRKVIAKIQRSLEDNFRHVSIILYYPDIEYTYFLRNCTNFMCVNRVAVSKKSKDEKEEFLIYRN